MRAWVVVDIMLSLRAMCHSRCPWNVVTNFTGIAWKSSAGQQQNTNECILREVAAVTVKLNVAHIGGSEWISTKCSVVQLVLWVVVRLSPFDCNLKICNT